MSVPHDLKSGQFLSRGEEKHIFIELHLLPVGMGVSRVTPNVIPEHTRVIIHVEVGEGTEMVGTHLKSWLESPVHLPEWGSCEGPC